jgi:hypothetical protein
MAEDSNTELMPSHKFGMSYDSPSFPGFRHFLGQESHNSSIRTEMSRP